MQTTTILRLDRPQLPLGANVRWQKKTYILEDLEIQGQEWTAVLVRPQDHGRAGAPCWFAPVREVALFKQAS